MMFFIINHSYNVINLFMLCVTPDLDGLLDYVKCFQVNWLIIMNSLLVKLYSEVIVFGHQQETKYVESYIKSKSCCRLLVFVVILKSFPLPQDFLIRLTM